MPIDIRITFETGGMPPIISVASEASGCAVSQGIPLHEIRRASSLVGALGMMKHVIDQMIAEAEKFGPGA